MSAINDIFEGLVEPTNGSYSPELARHILSLRFSDEQVARYEQLAYRVQYGAMPPDERAELDAFVAAGMILTIMQSKARLSLKRHNAAAPAPDK